MTTINIKKIKNQLKTWIEEADAETIERVFNENYDEPIKYIGDSLFEIEDEFAKELNLE